MTCITKKTTTIKTIQLSIIEDNKSIRDGVGTYVGFQEDMELVFATDSVEAFLRRIEKSETKQPDILLLDIGLPGISGVEGIPYILEKLPDLDIIMLTTYEEETVILKAICGGACSYLSKRASLDEIIEAIRIVDKGGSYMSPVIAREIVQYLMGGQVSKATMLTERQKSILKELVKGKTSRAIAKELFISTETVRSHIKRMYKALHINSKAEAIAMYLKGEIK